jgi:hypothetical protein
VRGTIAGTLLLFSTSAMAGTYVPVHVAPIVHVAPVIHAAPMVHAAPALRVAPVVRVNPAVRVHTGVRPTHAIGRTGSHHRLPVVVYATPQNPRKCVDQKSASRDCAKK